jgi:probable phosphoglycerate mutase
MQLLVIRHALPLRSEPGQGADPDLSEEGIAQAKRLPDALERFSIKRIVSSPQRRAMQTAQPVADKLGLAVDIDDRLAEYDRDLEHYTPIEEASQEDLQRLIDGHLPGGVDEEAFIARVKAGVEDIVATAEHEDTVALFSHGGVINALIHDIMATERLLCVQVDYAGITRLLKSRHSPRLGVATVNSTEHVWDLLPRNVRW